MGVCPTKEVFFWDATEVPACIIRRRYLKISLLSCFLYPTVVHSYPWFKTTSELTFDIYDVWVPQR